MKNKVLNFLQKYDLLDEPKIFLVAFSGGADSLSLIDVFYNLSKECDFKVVAAHLNHNWRGDESKAEEEFCARYCKDRNIEFYSKVLDKDVHKTELEARNQRYFFFDEVIAKTNADYILTGHTKSDNVETVLYRIIKGTGLNGLKGIPEKRDNILRPILDCTREETIEYCKANNLEYQTDSSNIDQKYARNKIRNKILPELESFNTNISEAILRLSDIATDSENLIDDLLKDIKEKTIIDSTIVTNEFINHSKAIQKQLLVEFLSEEQIEYNYKKIDEILSFIMEHKNAKCGITYSLTTNKWLFVSSKTMKVINKTNSTVIKSLVDVDINKDGEFLYPALNKILKITKWKNLPVKAFPKETEKSAYVDLSEIKEKIYLRTRQDGDRIQPFGMSQTTKLKKYFINKAIPEYKRDEILLLATKNEILWAIGIGISQKLKVKDKPTHFLTLNEEDN